MSNQQVVILGVGNVLHADDGIGVKTLQYLDSQYEFPEGVTLVDGGTVGAQLDVSIANKDWVIVIDALAVEGTPGEVRVLTGGDLVDRQGATRMSPHQVCFLDLIQLLKIEGTQPKRLDLVGIVPGRIEEFAKMTSAVDHAMDEVVDTLLEMLKAEDILPLKRDPALKPNYWWL